MHSDGWRHFTETQSELQRSFAALGLGERLHLLEAGAPTRLSL